LSSENNHFPHEDQLKQGYVFDPDSYPFDALSVHTDLQLSSDKSSERFAMQFGFRSIAPGRDPRAMGGGTPGRETGSAAKILNKINVLLRVHLLGLRCPLFPESREIVGNVHIQIVASTRSGGHCWERRRAISSTGATSPQGQTSRTAEAMSAKAGKILRLACK